MTDVVENKRPITDELESVNVKRRKPLNELSEEGPLTQDDVVYFQKEAIWRQMVAYKQKSQQLSSELSKFQRKYNENEDKVNILNAWYEQIVTLFSTNGDGNLNDSLLISFPTKTDDIPDVLEKRRKQLVEILTPLIERLKQSSPGTETLEVITKLETLNNELASVKTENVKLLKAKQDLVQQVEELQASFTKILKEKERLNSKTLKRVDESLQEEVIDEPKPSEQDQVSAPTEPTSNSNGTNTEEVDEKLEKFEQMEIELEALKSNNALLSVQIAEVNKKYENSVLEVLILKEKLNDLKESDLENNVHYTNLIKNNRSLQDQIAKLTKINEVNISKFSAWEEKQNSLEQLVNNELQGENTKLKEQLQKTETDLTRIRALRDDFMSKNAILTSQLENLKTNEELVKLSKILSDRIDQLQSESIEKASSVDQESSKDDLLAKVGALSAEIKEIEVAFRETREITLKKLNNTVDQENMLKKLTIEKTKADQKYFAAMRLKDSLQNEVKLLKVQVNKSQDLIKNFSNLEKNYLSKIEVLTKSVNDYKVIKDNGVQEASQLQESIRLLKNKAEIMESDYKKARSTIEAKTKEVLKLETETNSHRVTIDKLEKTLRSTESLLKKYKTNNTSSILQEDEQQLEALRSIAKCSVCTKNWKDTAITVCGHVFCHSCTQERLAARLRRCPSCNKGFSANDLLSVHL